MVMFLIIGVSILVASLAILSLTVLLRSSGNRVNRSFAYSSLALALWVLFNFIGANFKQFTWSQIFVYADFLTGPIVALLFSYFTIDICVPALKNKELNRLKLVTSVLAAAATAVILLPGTINVSFEQNELLIVYGTLFDLYSLLMLLIFVISIAVFVSAWKKSKDVLRKQLSTILLGLVTAIVFVTTANLAVPLITDSVAINLLAGNLAYLSISAYVFLVAVTIVRHKLFDIRLIIARSVAYILSLTFIGVLYAVTAFIIVDGTIFRGQEGVSASRSFVYTALALFFGLSFAPSKKLFDRLSNRFFYRDAYDSQKLIDDFSSVLVSNTELDILLEKADYLLRDSIKMSYLSFNIYKEDKALAYPKAQLNGKYLAAEKAAITKLFKSNHDKVIDLDLFDESGMEKNAKQLKRKGVSLAVDLSNKNKRFGYMVLGAKKSGNVYSKNDKEIFEIIADGLSLAIENSLRYEEIERFNETLQDEVGDATKKLRSSNAKLKTLDATKDEFISMASHQLRTPLTSIKGYISMVLEGDAGRLNEQQKKMLSQAFVSSQRMNYLISDLLNVSRLKTGRFVIESKPTNLPAVIQQELDQLYDTASVRSLELKFDPPKDFPELNLDETKIRQVIMNFVDNAIYYTQPGGTITIDIAANDKTVELKVVDTGLGVPKKEQHNLFSKFYRADNARRARPDGTGLGLFMAKKVVIAQGGAIIFKSQEGKGSTFGFSFPRKKLEVKK